MGRRLGQQYRKAFFADPRKETIFGAKEVRLRDTFLFPQVLREQWVASSHFSSGGHLVAGGSGLVKQVHRTLEA